jgi:hypothetical protein
MRREKEENLKAKSKAIICLFVFFFFLKLTDSLPASCGSTNAQG